MRDRASLMPSLVRKLVIMHNAWIVGSAANPANNPTECRDIDVMVLHSEWPKAAQLIPSDAKPNTFGGWKIQADGISIDVWPDDLGRVLLGAKTEWIWQPQTNTYFKRVINE
jgi:hypothetical protein